MGIPSEVEGPASRSYCPHPQSLSGILKTDRSPHDRRPFPHPLPPSPRPPPPPAPAPAPPATLHDEPLTLPPIAYPAQAPRRPHPRAPCTSKSAVDSTGHVFGVRAIDGPDALRQAAIDAYAKATYKPLLTNGVAGPAVITTAVNFSINEAPPEPVDALGKRFQSEQGLCQQLSNARSAEALPACRHAVDTSHQFAPGAELEARATSLNDLALLYMNGGKKSAQLAQAAALADEAVTLVDGSSPHSPAVAIAYITRAEVRSLQGDLEGAEADCSVAEEALSTTLTDYPESERAGRYRVQLRETYQLHAVVLDRQPSRAHKAEATQLRALAANY